MIKLLQSLKLLFILLIAINLCSCNNDDDSNATCDGMTECTDVFVTFTVSIKDQNQNPVALDAFEVINIENGNTVTEPISEATLARARELGIYPLVSDGSLEANEERQIQFRGFINDEEVINNDYTVTADCCHLSSVSGNLELTL